MKPTERSSRAEMMRHRAELESKYGHKLELPVISRIVTTARAETQNDVITVDDVNDDTFSVAGSDCTAGGGPKDAMYFAKGVRGSWGKLKTSLNEHTQHRAKWAADTDAGLAYRIKCFENRQVYPCKTTKLKVERWMDPEFATSEYIEASKTYHLSNPHS